jgi:phytoene desaturase
MSKAIIIIGAGFAGLSAASFMARAGWKVTVIEKNSTPGGRARQLKHAGFVFDMGPSFYWMPDVFERYFANFGKKPSDYYTLQRLDPSYRVYWDSGHTDIPASYIELKKIFESIEKGSGDRLDKYLKEAANKYQVGMGSLVYKPGLSLMEFLDWTVIKGIFRLDLLQSIRKHIAKHFSHPKLRQLMEFPILFLGALPENTPALYSLMNYADIMGGTWYPNGGMYQVVEGMYQLAKELGVHFEFDQPVTEIIVKDQLAREVRTAHKIFNADVVISGADYQFTESRLLKKEYRSYSEEYWNKRVLAPSALLYFLGLNKKLQTAVHHSLFFDVSFERHAEEIYKTAQWPSEPLFYASIPSVTDRSTAPPGFENMFLLIPVAAGLNNDTEQIRESYLKTILGRMEKRLREKIQESIIFSKSYSVSDFVYDYNSFKGNAYGLANTLKQTAILKPSCRSKKVKNLFYTGQLTVPGPGVPPSLISGELVATQVIKLMN